MHDLFPHPYTCEVFGLTQHSYDQMRVNSSLQFVAYEAQVRIHEF